MKKWGSLIILTMATFIIVVDTTIMNVSVPALVEDLNTTVTGVQGAISIYALVMASVILAGGKLADIIGMKKTFFIGAIIFGIGTSMAAVSTSLVMLIIGWSVFEGIGSALMIPNIQTILRSSYQGKERVFGYAIIGSIFAIAAAAGPLIGGFLTTFYSWRWAFAFEIAIVVIMILLNNLIKKDMLLKVRPSFDFIGAILSALGFSGTVLGILLSQVYGIWQAEKPFIIGDLSITPFGLSVAPFVIGFGVLMLMALYQWEDNLEQKKKSPLIKPSILKNSGLIPGMTGQFIQLLIAAGFLFIYPLYLQITFGLTAMGAGIALIPYSLAVLIFSLLGARLASKFISKKLIQAGFAISVIGFILMAVNIKPGVDAKDIILGSFVLGCGIGLIASQIMNLILSTVNPENTAEAAGINGVFGQLGNSIGVALIGGILLGTLLSGSSTKINESKKFTPEEKQILNEKIEENIEIISDTQLNETLEKYKISKEKKDEIVNINSASRSDAFASSIVFLAFVALIGLALSVKLPSKRLV